MNLFSQRLPRFLLTAALLYIGWYIFYSRIILSFGSDRSFDMALCKHITQASAGVLELLGYQAVAGGPHNTWLSVNGWPAVSVGWQCDGLPMMALFAGFIIAYPGPWRAKLWYIPMGLLVIHFINILRVVGLALNQVYWRSSMEFNHHYTFAIVVYGFIFLLWTIWVRRFASPPTAPPTATSAAASSVPTNA